MKQGTVKEYDPIKGFGFITDAQGDDYFVHISGLRPQFKKQGLRAGQQVKFDVEFGMKGDKAINVGPV